MASWLSNLMNKNTDESPKFGTMSIHDADLEMAEKMLTDIPGAEAIADLEQFATTYLHAEAVFAFGTEPLDVALSLLKKGSMIVAPAFIHKNTAEAFARQELKVKWVDIELESFGPVYEELKVSIEGGADALFLPHFLGIPSNALLEIVDLCRANQVLIIEDCRQALGGLFDGKPLGSFGDWALFSFNVMMPVNTMQGGLVSINNTNFSEKVKEIQSQAQDPSFTQKELLENFIEFYNDRKMPDKGLLDIKHDNKYWEKKWTFMESVKATKMYPAQATLAKAQFAQAESFGYYRQNHLRYWQDVAKEYNWVGPKPIEKSAPGWLRAPFLVAEEQQHAAKKLENKPEIGRWYCETSLPQGIDLELFVNTQRATREIFQFPTEM